MYGNRNDITLSYFHFLTVPPAEPLGKVFFFCFLFLTKASLSNFHLRLQSLTGKYIIFVNVITFTCYCKARLDRPNDGSRSAGEGLLRITVFPFSRHNKIKWNTFSYIFYLVISSDSINEKVLMISVHH